VFVSSLFTPAGVDVSFIARFRQIHAELERQGIPAFDMRDEGHLENIFVGATGADPDGQPPRNEAPLTWLENDSTRPRVIQAPGEASRIRYFLDGTQRTLRALYCDNLPIVVGVVGAAVIRRDDDGRLHVVPGMVGFKRFWVAPRRAHKYDLDRLLSVLEDAGEEIVDPLEKFSEDRYAAELADFGGVIEHAFKRVGVIRQELEQALVLRWNDEIGDHDGMLLVDGPLRAPVTGAIGLVKSFTRQYVSGAESATLFRLKHGERTAAFSVTDGWRSDTPVQVWYQRHWDATGRDPRHALIRIELFDGWVDHPSFDDVSAWVLRERLPAARADARWATLLYPIHHLEEVLKGELEAQTRGWSANV